MDLQTFSQHLTELLDIPSFASADISLNGLQVGDEKAQVRKVAFAVDATLATIRKAVELGADVLFVHHGLFWGRPIAITGRHYDRVSTMLENNLALFACHLPLDSHDQLGHNVQMPKILGMTDVKPFSRYHGVVVGYKGVLPQPMTADQIIQKLGIRTNPTNFRINTENRTFSKVGFVSGDGAEDLYQALSSDVELLVTGESQYSVTSDCIESGLGMLCLGHYETEVFGVKAVQAYVQDKLGLETAFIDIPLGL